MSLESKIESLTAALVAFTDALNKATVSIHTVPQAAAPVAPVVAAPVAPPAPVAAPVVAAPVVPEVVAPPVVAAPVMPPAPVFTAPVAAPAAPSNEPFQFPGGVGVMEYAVASYQALGAEKGAKIQDVLKALGLAEMSDLKPEHYQAFYQGVEALKA